MKILEKRYPKGSLPKQQTAGRYIDGTLWDNINILAKAITKDITYLGIISSSTYEVGTGKSVFAQQVAEAYLEAVKQHHKIDNKLTMENIVFSPKDLIDRAFNVPRYSVIISDEWEDLHYWSDLGISLRQFFRKCRQLNLFIIIIIPNFFQLPISYAIPRSIFLIDVRFHGEFDRGYFSFYNFSQKKDLYIKGKKTQNYGVTKPSFTGRFANGYVVDEKQYREAKLRDMINQDKKKQKEITFRDAKVLIFQQVREKMKDISIERLSKGFGISLRTGTRWLKADVPLVKDTELANTILLSNEEDDGAEEKDLR